MKVKQYDDNLIIRVKDKDIKKDYEQAVKALFEMSVSEFVRDKLDEILKIYSRR